MPYKGRQRKFRRPHTAIDEGEEHMASWIAIEIGAPDSMIAAHTWQFLLHSQEKNMQNIL